MGWDGIECDGMGWVVVVVLVAKLIQVSRDTVLMQTGSISC